jgi:hypothetical protein
MHPQARKRPSLQAADPLFAHYACIDGRAAYDALQHLRHAACSLTA